MKGWSIFWAVLAFGVVSGLFFWSRQSSPADVAKALFDMNLPARLAFVADVGSRQLVAVDVEDDGRTLLSLQADADYMAVDKVRGVMAYASADDRVVFLRHLTSHVERRVVLPHEVRGLGFESARGDLWVQGGKALSVVGAQGELRFSISDFKGLYGVHFDVLAEQVVVLDEGAVLRFSLDGELLQRFVLPPTWQGFSSAALSPGGDFLLFGVYDGALNQYAAVVLQMADGGWQVYPMSARLRRPIVDNGAQWLFFVDESGQGLRVRADDLRQSRFFSTIQNPQFLALGWLDAYLLVAGDGQLALYDAQSLAVRRVVSVPGRVGDVFVMADSKTVLLSLLDGHELFFVDMREGGVRSVFLGDAVRTGGVIMGASYTLCH